MIQEDITYVTRDKHINKLLRQKRQRNPNKAHDDRIKLSPLTEIVTIRVTFLCYIRAFPPLGHANKPKIHSKPPFTHLLQAMAG